MACTSKGIDMSLDTFRNALKYDDDSIAIGGGEPTLHPLFWQILMESLAISESVWMATNGSITPIALSLAKLAKKGIISVALSQDEFHDPIDSVVVQAFQKNKGENDYREIRNVSGHLIKTGRCKNGKKGCICEDLFVRPNGDVFGCGCKDAKYFGNVNKEVNLDDYEYGECTGKK